MPVIAPERKAMARPAARLWLEAWAVRTLARTDTIMPAKPAAPDKSAPMRNPMATVSDRNHAMMTKTTTPTAAIVAYCRRRYAVAPSWMAAAISCMRAEPASAARTSRAAQTL